jgi:urease accessory protein
MIRATTVHPAGSFAAEAVRDRVALDFDDRRRRRGVLTAAAGLEFLVDLAETPALVDGDALGLEDGGLVAVTAAAEKLVEFRVADPVARTRLAWRLGSRNVPTEIVGEVLRIRDDPVLVEMVKKQGGAEIVFVEAPFEPEVGAHRGAAAHDHAHSHEHSHAEDPAIAAALERRARRRAERAATGHVHGPDCGCGHDHDHAHDHDHPHDHDHGHDHDHDHDHDHGHDHVHDHDHVHGHDHDHDHPDDHDHDHRRG